MHNNLRVECMNTAPHELHSRGQHVPLCAVLVTGMRCPWVGDIPACTEVQAYTLNKTAACLTFQPALTASFNQLQSAI
jgi:hypothetical protein